MTYGTASFDLNAEPAIFELAIRALAEGNAIRSAARIVQIDKDTVCSWLSRAAHQCWGLTLYHWHKLRVRECQLDELWSFVHTKEQNLFVAKQWCETYGDAWVWLAFAPIWRLVVAFVVGKRTQEHAKRIVLAGGQEGREYFPYRCAAALADRLRTAVVEFPGSHAGFVDHPREFAKRLRQVFGDEAAK